VELDLDPQLPEILADKNRLEQIFLNLITNARDAMTARDDGAPRRLRVTSRLRGDKVLVEFSDTGVGMTEEVKRRIFEPFFTTKPPGEGTGLGLSISYNLVKDFKGTIEVESEPGKGATFRLTFPARRESESHGEEAASHR
jgi:histidine kinase